MTAPMLQIMVLPPTVADALPQILLEQDGVWRETVGAPIAKTPTKLRQETEMYLTSIMAQVGGNPPVPVSPADFQFRNHFQKLTQNLLPPDVLKLLRNQPGSGAATLNIFMRQGTEWIPWELLHDGAEFLGLKFCVTRLPVVPQTLSVAAPRACSVRRVHTLLARHVLDDEAFDEWQTTFKSYSAAADWERRHPANGSGDYPNLNAFGEAREANVLHFTCHGGLDSAASEDYFWTLDHKSPNTYDYRLRKDDAAAANFTERPLVFGNACSSIKGEKTDLGTLGFGANFLIGGALNFIGTFAPITKTTAIRFAARFYTHLFGTAQKPGLSVGAALRATKAQFAAEDLKDPSYLFYCLYGPADSTYRPA